MAEIIALVNHKGGVGKTTTTLNLGKALSLQGKKVLLIDLDPQANLSQSLGLDDPERSIYHALVDNSILPIVSIASDFDLVPSDLNLSVGEARLQGEHLTGYLKLKNLLASIETNYDFILIDCPPSLGLLTNNAFLAANGLLIILEPQYLAVKGLQAILELFEHLKGQLNPRLEIQGILFTQFNRTVVSKSIIEQVSTRFPNKVLQTIIRQNVKLNEASACKQDIFSYDPNSYGAEDYKALATELLSLYHH
jgi:chromosome partitioning protein